MSSGWQLRAVAPGSASATLSAGALTEWFCREGGQRARTQDFEFGYPSTMSAVMMSMQLQAAAMAQKRGISPHDLLPDWRAQIIRVRSARRGRDGFEWHRTGEAATVGEVVGARGQRLPLACRPGSYIDQVP